MLRGTSDPTCLVLPTLSQRAAQPGKLDILCESGFHQLYVEDAFHCTTAAACAVLQTERQRHRRVQGGAVSRGLHLLHSSHPTVPSHRRLPFE